MTNIKANYLSGDGQARMIKNGWRIALPNSCYEGSEEIYDRLSKIYSNVKIYYSASRLRGYHSYFAMVK